MFRSVPRRGGGCNMRRYILQIVLFLCGLNGERRFISIGDDVFEGEDPVLQAELSRRMAVGKPLHPPLVPDDRSATRRHSNVSQASQVYGLAGVSGRRQFMSDMFPRDRTRIWGAPDLNKFRALHFQMMKQAIYSVEGQIRAIEGSVSKYEDDIRFKISFTTAKLNDWLYEMYIMLYSLMPIARHPHEVNVTTLLTRYTNVLRRNIDITYTVDYVFELQKQLREAMARHKRLMRDKIVNIG